MSKPSFTDAWRHAGRYNTAAESREPGYLKRRFAEITERERIALEESNTQRRALNRVTPLRAIASTPAPTCVERKKRE